MRNHFDRHADRKLLAYGRERATADSRTVHTVAMLGVVAVVAGAFGVAAFEAYAYFAPVIDQISTALSSIR